MHDKGPKRCQNHVYVHVTMTKDRISIKSKLDNLQLNLRYPGFYFL